MELEVQILDRITLDLSPKSAEILARQGQQQWLQPELLEGMLEVNSFPRSNVHEAGADLRTALLKLRNEAEAVGAVIACAGTHPSAKHWEREPHSIPRYKDLIDRNQFIARRLMIFGMHVHIGVESGELCIALMNEMLYELPLLLALSASSPFWEGIDTGLASSRSTVFEAIPTGGHPCTVRDWNEFDSIVAKLIRSKAIRNVKDIWWDVRPSPGYGTLEIRVCDILPSLEENLALTALIHALAHEQYRRIKAGRTRPVPPDWMIRENKWRAARHGIEADLVENEQGDVVPMVEYGRGLIKRLEPDFKYLNYTPYAAQLLRILDGHTSYARQRKIFEQSHSLKTVTRFLAQEMTRSLVGHELTGVPTLATLRADENSKRACSSPDFGIRPRWPF